MKIIQKAIFLRRNFWIILVLAGRSTFKLERKWNLILQKVMFKHTQSCKLCSNTPSHACCVQTHPVVQFVFKHTQSCNLCSNTRRHAICVQTHAVMHTLAWNWLWWAKVRDRFIGVENSVNGQLNHFKPSRPN